MCVCAQFGECDFANQKSKSVERCINRFDLVDRFFLGTIGVAIDLYYVVVYLMHSILNNISCKRSRKYMYRSISRK